MKATQIIFNMGERVYPDEARAMVARLLDSEQSSLVQAVMNYGPDKKSITGFPVVQFAYNKYGFALNGFGELGVMAASDIAPVIHAKLAKETGKIITISMRELALSVESRPYSISYTVPRMVIQKKTGHLARIKDPVEGAAHLENLFLNSLKRQAEAVGIDLPSNLKVTFKSATGTFAAKPNPSKSGANIGKLGLHNATFEVNARLGGIWAVGYLLSKGYGSFNADMQLGCSGEQ